MKLSSKGALRVSLSRKRTATTEEGNDPINTDDFQCEDGSQSSSRPLTFYYSKPAEGSEETTCFHILLDTSHEDAQEATQVVNRLAVAKTRGTLIEEYALSREKIAWLGGQENAQFLHLFFSLCEDSPIRRSAWAFTQRIIASYKYARLLLHWAPNTRLDDPFERILISERPQKEVKTGAEYLLESDDLNTLQSIYADTDLSEEGCFPSPTFAQKSQAGETKSSELQYLSIAPNKGTLVKQICMQKLNVRLRCEYEYKTDTRTREVRDFRLRDPKSLRGYQTDAIDSVFFNDRICSGLIVLPCGAGKTLTGISIAARLSKRLLILCVNTFSVYQWRDQLLRWTTLSPSSISVITATLREEPADIVITTYTMLTMEDDRRNAHSKELVSAMLLEPFGLVILDEVHMAAAKNFRRVVEIVSAHCFLGLTATLLREDEKIDDLDYLIGPLLYECSMYTLKNAGSIADVVCAEVLCPLPQGYLLRYLNTTNELDRRKIYNMNPAKIWCCQALIHYHENRSPPDKTLVFVDSIAMLELCARLFKRPMIHGETNDFERECVLSWFKNSNTLNTIFISRIGDSALDIPETNVLIQLSSLFGSQRTEVQRIGRIQRLKKMNRCAYFYSLVTPDTREVAFSNRRKQFLLSEGYGYNVVDASEITREIFSINAPQDDTRSVLPMCVGVPSWGFQASNQTSPLSVATRDALNIENAIRYGKSSVKIHAVNHSIPHATDTDLPSLCGTLTVGPLIRSRAHDGYCQHECLELFLGYINSDSRDYLEYLASNQSISLDFQANQDKAKFVEKAVKAHTQSSAFKRRDKAIHTFRRKLAQGKFNTME
ncbi:DNA repair helicase and transcription factor protein [Perkinsela sp. CCAP 1560/4]|nr:DNA repair helicase and transcription factor protein [Perkinsela sp. CCAP 1560/4]|eukprot:KNH09540.1 DNA repair helicase and transcription factor protein [Perkinsela sp. CCAP 1560/4]